MRAVTLDDLTIHDEAAFAGIGAWRALRARLRADGFAFRVAERPWPRVLFLNLTYWNAAAPSDVLEDDSIEADVVSHAAWHHAARTALAVDGRMSVEALFLGEAIASAFDVYLIGRLMGRVACGFLETQVPAMAEAAAEMGADDAFESLLDGWCADPDAAFESLRQLLFDASCAVFAARDAASADAALDAFRAHPCAPLLHHFELSNWLLYARAYGDPAPDPGARALDAALRQAPSSVDWLAARWLPPDA